MELYTRQEVEEGVAASQKIIAAHKRKIKKLKKAQAILKENDPTVSMLKKECDHLQFDIDWEKRKIEKCINRIKKFELTEETKNFYGRKLYRIRALKDFGNVKAGDLGGWVEREANLSQYGECWVYNWAIACGESHISGAATVEWNAVVSEQASISGHAKVCMNAHVYGHAHVMDNAIVGGMWHIRDYVRVCCGTVLYGKNTLGGEIYIRDNKIG